MGQKQPFSIICHVLGQKQPLCPSFTTLSYHVPWQNCMLNLPACFTGGSSSGGSSQCQDRLSNCADYGQNACVGQYVPWAKDNCPKTCNLCPSKQQGGGGGGRQRETQTDRQTDRHREAEKERQRERHREADTERHRETHTENENE